MKYDLRLEKLHIFMGMHLHNSVQTSGNPKRDQGHPESKDKRVSPTQAIYFEMLNTKSLWTQIFITTAGARGTELAGDMKGIIFYYISIFNMRGERWYGNINNDWLVAVIKSWRARHFHLQVLASESFVYFPLCSEMLDILVSLHLHLTISTFWCCTEHSDWLFPIQPVSGRACNK